MHQLQLKRLEKNNNQNTEILLFGDLSHLHLLFKLKNQHTCCTNMCNLQTRQAWFITVKPTDPSSKTQKTVGFGGWKTPSIWKSSPHNRSNGHSAPVPSCHRPKQRCSTSSRKRSIPTARGSTSWCEPVPDVRDWLAPNRGQVMVGWWFFFLRNGKKIINNNRDDGFKGMVTWMWILEWWPDVGMECFIWPNIRLHLDPL